jgi:hypothetical protein
MNNEMKFSNNEIKQNENREFLKRTEKNAKKKFVIFFAPEQMTKNAC